MSEEKVLSVLIEIPIEHKADKKLVDKIFAYAEKEIGKWLEEYGVADGEGIEKFLKKYLKEAKEWRK